MSSRLKISDGQVSDGHSAASKRAILAAMGAVPALNLPSYAGARWARQEAENDNAVPARKVSR